MSKRASKTAARMTCLLPHRPSAGAAPLITDTSGKLGRRVGPALPAAYEAPSDSASRVRAMLAPSRASAASRSHVQRAGFRYTSGSTHMSKRASKNAGTYAAYFAALRTVAFFAERERRAEYICVLPEERVRFFAERERRTRSIVIP